MSMSVEWKRERKICIKPLISKECIELKRNLAGSEQMGDYIMEKHHNKADTYSLTGKLTYLSKFIP